MSQHDYGLFCLKYNSNQTHSVPRVRWQLCKTANRFQRTKAKPEMTDAKPPTRNLRIRRHYAAANAYVGRLILNIKANMNYRL